MMHLADQNLLDLQSDGLCLIDRAEEVPNIRIEYGM